MDTAERLSAIPFQLLDPLYQAWRRGIARLHLIPSETEAAHPSWIPSAESALARLSEAGLVCRLVAGRSLYIQGGLSSFVVRGVQGYACSFAIIENAEGGFTAAVASAQHLRDEKVSVTTLAQAVDTVLQIYRSRGMPSEVDRRDMNPNDRADLL